MGSVIPFPVRPTSQTSVPEPEKVTCEGCGKLVPKCHLFVDADEELPLPAVELVYIVLRCSCGTKLRIRSTPPST